MPKKISTHAPRFDFVQTKVKKEARAAAAIPLACAAKQNKPNQIIRIDFSEKNIFWRTRKEIEGEKDHSHSSVQNTVHKK